MLDFMKATSKITKNGVEIYPKFIVKSSEDLMVRGNEFYAIWDEENNLWSTKEEVALYLIDKELKAGAEEYKKQNPDCGKMHIAYMWDGDTKMVNKFHQYVKEQLWDNYVSLDERLIFQNTQVTKTDYASMKLPYSIGSAPIPAWEELISTLYSPTERHKIEWAIGAIISGDSKDIQKFLVMYGAPKTGKSTVLNIIQLLFQGYWSVFDAKSLGNPNNTFAMEPFKANPLVAIQHDGDLSKIEDNTRLNSIVSHETMVMNEKFKSAYPMRFNSFLIMGTNKPVRITDSKSGIIRRLIDVSPTGNKLPRETYDKLTNKIKFELGGIAQHCLDVYNEDPGYYNNYIPTAMIGASNDFYNFVLDSYEVFKRDDSTTLKAAYEMYKTYCDDARVAFPYSMRIFKEELKSYFKDFEERGKNPDDKGSRVRNLYSGFITDKFMNTLDYVNEPRPQTEMLSLTETKSILDDICKEWPAQYSNENGTPYKPWDKVKTRLKDLDTTKEHYLLFPEEFQNYIVVDFDIKDSDGKKSFELNAEAAAKWPATYAECSKSGEGIHLHYIYSGDVNNLSRIYDDSIEIKIFTGKSSLRRKLTRCNNLPIATIDSGLPLKATKKMINFDGFKNEKAIRTYIKRNLLKEYPPHATKTSIDYIYKALEKAHEDNLEYDVSDMAAAVISFAGRSTHNADYCLNLTNKMKWKSEILSENFEKYDFDTLIFFDVEVFPNLFVVVYKAKGKNPVKLINPTPTDISELVKFKLIGFNNRDYDNHILYARLLGESNLDLYNRSKAIIANERAAKIGAAYNISYTDIYDFAAKKQSLKKWEISLGIHHQELGLPWDQPVPEENWGLVAEYCDNDVISTEAVFNHLSGDFRAREILADIAGMTVNDSTNSLTTRIIFGKEKKPKLNWYDLAEEFPGYKYKNGKNMYRGDDVGRGGWVYANPGMYNRCVTYDVASMHPRSIIMERYLGDYTDRFEDLVNIRLFIKHSDYESVGKLFDGKLKPYLKNKNEAKDLSNALKTAINSVYGLTSATFDNPFRDRRNKNNIVALRGALFMRTLQDEVESRGFTVVHIKTDSIKVADPTPEIEKFIYEFGEKYGYTFEVEAEWEKICLVNNAVFVGKQSVTSPQAPGKWTATGKQFQEPYVFKKIFSKEPIEFEDCCLTMTTKSAFYLDMNETLSNGESMPVFIGRAGCFCPIEKGHGGGELKRIESDGRLSYASGTKGYRFLESETVRGTETEQFVDKSYFDNLVDEAIHDISEFGDYYRFVDDNKDIPWLMPCGDLTMDNCHDCPHFQSGHDLCDLGFDISGILLRYVKEN